MQFSKLCVVLKRKDGGGITAWIADPTRPTIRTGKPILDRVGVKSFDEARSILNQRFGEAAAKVEYHELCK